MGNQPPSKPTHPPKPRLSISDQIIQMKIQAKSLSKASIKSKKEQEKYIKKAEIQLKKNNEDFAKMYLQSASQKYKESLNHQRMSLKIDLMCDNIKSMKSNEQIVQSFGKLTNAISGVMQQTDMVKMGNNMQILNNKMDEVLINNKMMNELITNNDQTDTTADTMLKGLKQKLQMQQKNKMNLVSNKTQEQKLNQKQKQSQKDPFLDQLDKY